MPDRFYIWEDDEQNGPYTETQVERMLEDGIIDFSHECEDAATGKRVMLDKLFADDDDENDNDEEWESAEEAGDTSEDEGEDDDEGDWEYEEEEGDDEQEEDEEWDQDEEGSAPPNAILFHGHPTLLRYVGGIALAALGIAFGLWLGPRDIWFFVGGFGVAALSIVTVLIHRSTRDYTVTPKRVEMIWGLFARSSQEARIEDIRTINVRKTGFIGMLGIGTVEFSSTGDGVDVAFTDIWGAQKVKLLVRKLQDEME